MKVKGSKWIIGYELTNYMIGEHCKKCEKYNKKGFCEKKNYENCSFRQINDEWIKTLKELKEEFGNKGE